MAPSFPDDTEEPTLAEDAPHPGASMKPDAGSTSQRGAVDRGADGTDHRGSETNRDPDHGDDARTDRPDPALDADASAGSDPQPGTSDDTSADASV